MLPWNSVSSSNKTSNSMSERRLVRFHHSLEFIVAVASCEWFKYIYIYYLAVQFGEPCKYRVRQNRLRGLEGGILRQWWG
jgi:hypothetical protein